MAKDVSIKIPQIPQYKPLINNKLARTIIGVLLYISSLYYCGNYLNQDWGNLSQIALFVGVGWLPAVYLTDKYSHKYPQSYYSYLFASHIKSALILAFSFLLIWLFSNDPVIVPSFLALALLTFMSGDMLISVFKQKQEPVTTKKVEKPKEDSEDKIALEAINTNSLMIKAKETLDGDAFKFIKETLPSNNSGHEEYVLFSDASKKAEGTNVALAIETISINNVNRLDKALKSATEALSMGGYLLTHFTPLEVVNKKMKDKYKGPMFKIVFISNFIWKRILPKTPILDKLYFSPLFSWLDAIIFSVFKRNRVLSQAEMYGRLISNGLKIVGKKEIGSEQFILTQRTDLPVQNKKPSYYAVVALEKVGLNGDIVRLHKVRSMYPYSEFVQKYMYETEGLTDMGKFKNEYRLTEYGPFIRKYWIDELPQLFDWLRGDIKLVGMRATSPHYLSLYPQEVYDLYIQVKPGLVPPIFDEKTTGFDEIVQIELDYLTAYLKHPMKTDIELFIKTFSDIFVRGVRSK